MKSLITHHPGGIVNLFTENEDLNIDISLPLNGNKHAPSTGIRGTVDFFLPLEPSPFLHQYLVTNDLC